MDRGLFGTFDYDRDYLQPPEPREERDPADWIFSAGQWIYVGDCQPKGEKMTQMTNKGKSFIRAEISEKQKEYIRLLAELRGVTTQELLGQVVERFIDRNLQLIQDYKNELDNLNSKSRRRIDMNTQEKSK